MIAVIQRVKSASVTIDSQVYASCGKGLLILLGVAVGDTEEDARLLSAKIAKLRIFSDDKGKMNLSLKDVGGEAIVVSNFTLLASYKHGNRPDYMNSMPPAEANRLYEYFTSLLRGEIEKVGTGEFGADMLVDIQNDGPVTIVMDSSVLRGNAK